MRKYTVLHDKDTALRTVQYVYSGGRRWRARLRNAGVPRWAIRAMATAHQNLQQYRTAAEVVQARARTGFHAAWWRGMLRGADRRRS